MCPSYVRRQNFAISRMARTNKVLLLRSARVARKKCQLAPHLATSRKACKNCHLALSFAPNDKNLLLSAACEMTECCRVQNNKLLKRHEQCGASKNLYFAWSAKRRIFVTSHCEVFTVLNFQYVFSALNRL